MSTTAVDQRVLLRVDNLSVAFRTDGAPVQAVKNIAYELYAGETLAIVGESGSGKTVGSRAVVGLLPDTATITGQADLDTQALIGLGGEQIRRVRGDRIAMIFQEPSTALDPVRTVGWQICEALQVHRKMTKTEAMKRAVELLDLVGIPDPAHRVHAYPHQLSGGQKQRVMIAMAISCDPEILVADEPTTALDVTVQAQILDLLRDLQEELGMAIILITHNMGVVADLADRVAVMYRGEIVEQGTAHDIFENPQHPYTQALLAAVPHLGRPRPKSMETPVSSRPTDEVVMSVTDVVVDFPGRIGSPGVRAVDNVSLDVHAHEIVALVGESGSGKTTLGRCTVGLQPVTRGAIEVLGTNIVKARGRALREYRRRVGFVFQDPAASLNPRMTVGDCIAEPLLIHNISTPAERIDRARKLLEAVELPADYATRYPHELSGGQRQRVSLARALVTSPEFVVADEPTSALDVSVQARVLEVFVRLQHQMGFACLFVTHDLAVVDMLADRIAVMQLGRIVELGTREQILRDPQQQYTRDLIASVPVPNPAEQSVKRIERRALRAAAQDESDAATPDSPEEGLPEGPGWS
ncbi:MAG: ABC transporter ATP-binding protein [Propionibacteriaceae bacterium]|nr:ABC transporter ATP-binding protein [Propionibacteriaceae bacterium]